MKLNKSIVALTSLVAFAATPLFAGTGKTFKETVVVEEEAAPWYNAALSTGWDSLYMFRGYNTIRPDGNAYGSGIYWTDVSFTWNITDNDFLTIGSWVGFGTQNTSYKEFDARATYTHTFGDLAASLGYTFYDVWGVGNTVYANELNAGLAYTIDLGGFTITPSATYFFNLGPDLEDGPTNTGLVAMASSFLQFRLDASIPLYKDIIALAPYGAFGLNFGYNTRPSGDSLAQFDGANNLEFGLALPIKINKVITVSGYGAYSLAFYDLGGQTDENTFWGGAKVTFSF